MAQLESVHFASPAARNVVFLHGLGGHPKETWMHNPADHTTLWPKWVGEDAKCNVWVLKYDAALSSWTDSAMQLPDQGVASLNALCVEPQLSGSPLVLVGHSMGGLVIKEAIVHASTHDDSRLKRILEDLVAVIFIATPHQGSDLASLATTLQFLFKTNPQVGNMGKNDVHLKNLNGQFRSVCQTRALSINALSEMHPIFVGKHTFGFKIFGKDVMVVDRNSSDPGISGVTPIPCPYNHFTIAKPADRQAEQHRTLLSILDGLPADTAAGAEKKRVSSELVTCEDQFRRASQPLLTWPTTLPGGSWLIRPELETLFSHIRTTDSSLTLVLGEPGCGKSALLARLGQSIDAEGTVVLAIKADRLPEGVHSREALTKHLGLSNPIIDALRAMASTGSVLVLVDQLDALADLVVMHSARLRVLLELIHDLHEIKNIHIVATCRSFEHRHDPSLRNLEANTVNLALPLWEDVDALLQSMGVNASSWNPEMRETLRSPHALDTFLSLLDKKEELAVLKSFQSMLQVQWEMKVLCDTSGGRKKLLLDISRYMAEREVLGLPLALFDDSYALIQSLVAAGLLRSDAGSDRVEFRHQTLYEFVRAKSFLEEQGSLTRAVLNSKGTLRIRPQLWHALAYLREVDTEQYQDELGLLWQSDLRPHLRMLLIEFIGRHTAPLPREKSLAFGSFSDSWFQRRFLNAVVGSSGWFETLSAGHLPMMMASPLAEAAVTLPILEQALSFASETVMSLLDQHWLPCPDKDELSWRILGMGRVTSQDIAWVDRLERILSRTNFAPWAIGHAASTVSAVLPNEAPRLVAVWLTREWAKVKPLNDTVVDNTSVALTQQSPTNVTTVEKLLELRDFHDLPAIAEAAPQAFIESIWSILRELLEAVSTVGRSAVVGYRETHGLVLALDDDADSRLERPLIEAVQLAICAWAENEPETFLDFAKSNDHCALMFVQRLLSQGLARCASRFPGHALTFLCADPRRLVLGSFANIHQDSFNLIQAVAQHLDEAEFDQLKSAIMGWSHYLVDADDDAQLRRKRAQWDRQSRLRLLRALSKERMSPADRKHLDEEERAFPHLCSKDVTFTGAHFIGSPVSTEQMQKSQDEDILNLFNELTDEHDWDHPRATMKGGAIQAGRELARLAKAEPLRAVNLILQLLPGKNEIPVSEVLRELIKAGYLASDLFTLIEKLDGKGFSSQSFRHAAAYAICEAVSSDGSVNQIPDVLMTLLEGWLVPAAEASDAKLIGNESSDTNGSLLWGHLGMVMHPSGNFPVLSALSEACLRSKPQEMDAWLEILERHLSRLESPSVWAAMGWRYLQYLDQADRIRAQSFLDNLFVAFPSLLSKKETMIFVARLQGWIGPDNAQRWLESMSKAGKSGRQGFGEVLMLRHAIFPNEPWPRVAVADLLATSGEVAEEKIGVAHAIANLWCEPAHRTIAHGYLLPLLASPDKRILDALGCLFLKQTFLPDNQTREFLTALCRCPGLLCDQRAEHMTEHLESLVAVMPEQVIGVSNALLDQVGEVMGNMATSWYLSSEPLLAIALALQDMGDPYRAAGVALFERMLEFNLPQAQEMTLSLDKRTLSQLVVSAPRTRRRKKIKSVK